MSDKQKRQTNKKPKTSFKTPYDLPLRPLTEEEQQLSEAKALAARTDKGWARSLIPDLKLDLREGGLKDERPPARPSVPDSLEPGGRLLEPQLVQLDRGPPTSRIKAKRDVLLGAEGGASAPSTCAPELRAWVDSTLKEVKSKARRRMAADVTVERDVSRRRQKEDGHD